MSSRLRQGYNGWMSFADLIDPLIRRRDLSFEQARDLMRHLTDGHATEAQIGGVLLGLRVKGCTTQELAGFASVLRERAATLSHPYTNLVDTCGTGGGIPSFNISTAAAIVAAAAGVRIAKHGNRAVTSACGSADVLEALGIPVSGDPERLMHQLETYGIIFLYAPRHHPVMANFGKARKELGVRTIFNQLGPLANPAGASRQLIGVYDAGLMRSMGEALKELGTERALIVHGDDGLDEISPVTTSEYVKVDEGRVTSGRLHPSDFGQSEISADALAPGTTIADNAKILMEAVSDASSPRASVVIPSAGAAIWLGGLEPDFASAAARARQTIASGAAARKLKEIIEAEYQA